MININCIWNDRGWYCDNYKVKRSKLFGFIPMARCCVEFGSLKKCEHKQKFSKPRPSPPPPKNK